MKKLIAILLCMVCVLSLAVPVFAEEIAETIETVVSLELDPTLEHYTLTIPAEVKFDMTKEVSEVPIELKDVNFAWNKRLDVYLTAKNGCEEAWYSEIDDQDFSMASSYLIHTEDETKKILYGIKSGYSGLIYDGDDLIVASAYYYEGELDIYSNPLEMKILGEYPGAGTYTDTLTFTVKLSR